VPESSVPKPELPTVLASASPRRRQLLASLVAEFEAVAPDVPEDDDLGGAEATASGLAVRKARRGLEMRPGSLVLGGDTVVELPGHGLLGKPQDAADAVRTLLLLAGRAHTVVTGVALAWPGGERSFAVASEVRFHPFGEAEAQAYVATGEPMDKAGAYGYQGEGRKLVAGVRGSESNVVGLPLEALREALEGLPVAPRGGLVPPR
jgi:septum formation protein